MSVFSEAVSSIQSVLLLQSKVERLDEELKKTNDQMNELVRTMIAIDRRVVRLETIEEVRSGRSGPPRIEG